MEKIISKIFNIKILIATLFCLIISNPAFAIKIGLIDNVKTGYVAASTDAYIVDENTGKALYKIGGMKKYNLKKHRGRLAIEVNRKYFDLQTDRIRVKPASNKDFVSTKDRWYRGELLVLNNDGKLTFINDLDIELYLLGVVPSEMPSNWNAEALKAQAIVARSYALANLGKRAARKYDLKDTPEDQAYGGASSETRKTNIAVVETAGMVLTYDNKIIPAYYHASAGGHTLNSSNVWYKDLPYIKAVPSYDSNVPKKGHGVGMSQYGANSLAKSGYSAFQILAHFYNNVSIDKLKN